MSTLKGKSYGNVKLWPPAHHLNTFQLSASAVASSPPRALSGKVRGVVLFADSHWEPELNPDEGGHHSCQQSSQEGPSQCLSQCLSDQALTAHLGPRPSPTSLILFFSVFSEAAMHTTSVQTHIMQSFSHRCQAKGQTHSPRGEDNQVVIKTKQVQSR